MATTKQVQAAKRNVKKAQKAATSKRTIAKLPAATRSSLGEQAARGRAHGGAPGHRLEDRNRTSSTNSRRSGTSQAARRWASGS